MVPRSGWSNDRIGQKSCVIAYIRPHEFERVAAVAVHRETCSFQRKGCEALKGPATDHVAIDQRHNGLIAVIYPAGVSRAQVEAEGVIPRGKASNRLPDERARTLQKDGLAEGQSGEGRRREYSVRTSEAGANIQIGGPDRATIDPKIHPKPD